ncbi:MAG: hypothetical protein K0S53_416 [Bacteroidetes bacterium]|jgi:hypothetical protein|nr:hypothetical protein [Bacteroidota bacterium]
MNELFRIYETLPDWEGRKITYGDLTGGYIGAYHNKKQVALAYLSENIVGAEDRPVLMNIRYLDGYDNITIKDTMFLVCQFYYGDFFIEENLRQELLPYINAPDQIFKHLPFATTTDQPIKC